MILKKVLDWFSENSVFLIIFSLAFALRVYSIDTVPGGFYTDEVISGYEASSILQTGRDSNGVFMPLYFKASGDYREPIHIYSIVPFVALFGNTILSVRLATVLFAMISILFTYLFIKNMFSKNAAIFTAIILSFMPWHFIQGRFGVHIIVGIAFLSAGIYFFLRSLKDKKLFPLSMAIFSLSFYTYGTFRFFSFIIPLSLIFLHRKKFLGSPELKKGIIIFLLLILPFVFYYIFNAENAFKRSGDTIIFNPELLPYEIGYADYKTFSVVGNSSLYASVFMKNYLTYLSPFRLFFSGDENLRHMVKGFGEILLSSLPLILAGLFVISRNFNWTSKFLIFWLLIFSIPGSLTFDGIPHYPRAINGAILFSIIAGLGAEYFFNKSKESRAFLAIFILLALMFLADSFLFFNEYFFEYGKYSYMHFETNVGDAISYANSLGGDNIIVVSNPCCYYSNYYIAYFSNFPAPEFQKGNYSSLGWTSEKTYGKYLYSNVTRFCERNSSQPHLLIVKSTDQYFNFTIQVKQLYNPDGSKGYAIGTCS